MTEQARTAIGSEAIEAVADRGYDSGEEIVACEQAGATVYLPKPLTSGINAKGRFGKQDFVYVAADDVYLCPAGHVGLRVHNLFRECRYTVSVSGGPAVIKADIAIPSPTQLLPLLLEDLGLGLTFRIILCANEKHTNVFHPIGLLRSRGERPRSRSAANQGDKLAALHCPTQALDRTS